MGVQCCWICCIRSPAIKRVEPLELPYDCPYVGSGCSIKGNIPKLVKHLKNAHDVRVYAAFRFGHPYSQSNWHEIEEAAGKSAVFNCYGQKFCYHFESFLMGMRTWYIAFLQLMGEDTEAKRFRYSLQISLNDRMLMWQGVPRSIRDSHQKVRDSLDGLVIPLDLALLFSRGDEQELKLHLRGYVWIEE